jgi:amidase
MDFAPVSGGWNITIRYLRGIYDDVTTMPYPERLEPRTRTMARAGARISDGRIAKVRAQEAKLTGRINAIFNATGQPAAVIPWGLDHSGLPTSVQLVGRPHDEATLLAVSTQIETARPWIDRRPPTA